MFRIVMSQNEEYEEAIKLIVNGCRRFSVSVEAIEIEILKNTSFKDTDVVFFLTNNQRVGRFAAELSLRGIEVINGKYLVGNRAKSYAQRRARFAGVMGPRFMSGIDLQRLETTKYVSELGFPLYVKSERHEGGVFRAENVTELGRVIAGLDPSLGWYMETAVDAPDRRLEKLYWVAGSCFGRDKQKTPRTDVIEAMDAIGGSLSFDVFSADFILSESDYWCIDVNSAPGLFGSETAREALIGFVQSRLTYRILRGQRVVHDGRVLRRSKSTALIQRQ
ncbi:MAG: hypothetical protein A3A24_00225 [Candidatus Buchananbacteria bacterium RIFCSPLOWO2_01_FULL_46_12]|uniref:ATP-grasp domain-containing protein n=2 Tax=Candidatus Buchananiibacteriota TaxID=1817903 RepID=A0A1G1YRJ7_9BACT|nr:MAG: hypothetical protein A2744_04740 [Candidatus Buchananbacteria bacterium RIFCSPHIGHO2_01_FULL_44_11]OGY54436.1 MAG: hypothetical protein A3A24_00225 [Candidatus Buchananbacteria bacterium RIFCSPLOWO2_01_FULL_46_12]